ncbi:MAG: hypothetical protein ABI968_07095 [Acidobacteriota bacterium]
MRRRVFAFAGLACLAAPLCAEQLTQKFDYKPSHGVQEIPFSLGKVRIPRIVFRPGHQAGGPLKRSSGECAVRVENDGETPVSVGVAIVVSDADGNVVAAGTGGTRIGWLRPGERDTSTIRFAYVYRNFTKAKTFLITMEVQGKE